MAGANHQDKNKYGIVFNIQRYSVHDGPGIRTIVFLKGCPLHCRWCANPESQSLQPELAYNDHKCIGIQECGYCLKACTTGAIREKDDKIVIDREGCNHCGQCAEICPSRALNMYGKTMSVDEVLNLVEQDSSFYSRSGGGITLSGGEPLVQSEFAAALLKEAKKRRMNTAIETCGYADWDRLERVCEYTDTVLYDIKCIDRAKHKEYTGVDNEIILENFKRLCERFPDKSILVRTPVIPGFNDSEGDIGAIVEFIKGYPNVKYELLAYHRLGEPKYTYIGKDYTLKGMAPMQEERMAALKRLASEKMKKESNS
ncbi:(2S)-3-sulfopropanediol dehydratase activating enzyme [Desulforamulus ruminis]|uniref:Glycyl-radical enzyme activating protein family n=1 Tax=Desulforamulus ruminis (strain ATCC 23193 / DSM 2154 / NCIMB 8452 / DL) TaxID=696281 RepID=F6DRK8_DESRL|nr:glycyl-radical enzyme activating protein [Desulforamulus ruminis]AEG58762.1 glycyl-radical enzyme activating protein family [Desulforamulus ruminis DSM 2154]